MGKKAILTESQVVVLQAGQVGPPGPPGPPGPSGPSGQVTNALARGLPTAENLRITWASSLAATLTCDSIVLSDASGNCRRFDSISETLDITTSGANGLDTGFEVFSTWYYVWIIGKTDGTVDGLLSVSSTAPTLPSGYTFRARVGAIRNDGAGNFVRFYQIGNLVDFDDELAYWNLVIAGTSATEFNLTSSLAQVVPPIAVRHFGELFVTAGTLYLYARVGQTKQQIDAGGSSMNGSYEMVATGYMGYSSSYGDAYVRVQGYEIR